MTAQKGSAFLLKISNGASPATYQTVAGLRTTQMSISGDHQTGFAAVGVGLVHAPLTGPELSSCRV